MIHLTLKTNLLADLNSSNLIRMTDPSEKSTVKFNLSIRSTFKLDKQKDLYLLQYEATK